MLVKSLGLLVLIAAAVLLVTGFRSRKRPSEIVTVPPVKSFYELSVKGNNGEEIRMADFKGKKVLCVNVASECGYTPQYSDLQKLHEKYKDKLVLIGFPCNQFGSQEPGSNEEIRKFCTGKYGVTFLLTDKIEVKGDDQHPVYQWLTRKSENGKGDYEVKWNFNKFLVNEKGELVEFFGSRVKPFDSTLVALIER